MPARQTAARDLDDARDGGRYVLWPAQAGKALEVERERLGTGRLFVRGVRDPILSLRPR